VYCIPENSSALYPTMPQVSSVVSHNGRYFPLLWDTTEVVFFVVGYNGRSFSPLWDTTEEFFYLCGIQRKRFFPLWDIMGKNDTTKNDILKFLSASNCLQIKI
jgi:hypothetical protein